MDFIIGPVFVFVCFFNAFGSFLCLFGRSIGSLWRCNSHQSYGNNQNVKEIDCRRLQLQGELLKADPSLKTLSAADTFMAVVRNEGLRGLQKALIPAYIYQILCNGVRLGMYENLANTIQSKLDVFTETPGSLQMLSKISSGAISGITGAFVASPLFLIKTRIQSYSEVVSKATFGHQHTDSKKGVWFMLKSIYKKDGIRGLWRGADASMVRTGIGSAVQLTTYDYFKRDLQTLQYFKKENKNGFEIHFCASLLSSFFVCLFMNPFDVASTRMYNQKTALIGN
jgi:solute carrier family 25 protein 34/35